MRVLPVCGCICVVVGAFSNVVCCVYVGFGKGYLCLVEVCEGCVCGCVWVVCGGVGVCVCVCVWCLGELCVPDVHLTLLNEWNFICRRQLHNYISN